MKGQGLDQLPGPPKPASTRNRPRRRPDLTLPLPQRDTSLAVPLPLPPTSAPSSSSNPNHRILIEFSQLEKISRIGSGTGGTVYKVVHRPTGKIYALKVIYGNHEDNIRTQIRREIQILRDVDDSNVVRCHDMFDQGGEMQVLLEYMDGGSLEGTHIQNEYELAGLSRQILSGLLYLHRRKIVHRDIKPSNLLVNSLKQVKIADFGVSRILAQTMDLQSSVGTIAYMSPERIDTNLNHGRYDGYAGDIWSVGVSILEFYMGRFPFSVDRQQSDWVSLMCAICMSHPPEAPPTASPEFRDFIACCLHKDPHRRWSAGQLLRHPFIAQLGNSNHNPSQQHHMLPPPPRSV